jgi:hypothetical protein
LDGVFDEVAARQHQPATVPDPHHHVGEGDLLDVAPLALHDHGVVQADGPGEGDLQTRDEVADRRASATPAIPAEASRLAPSARPCGRVSSIMATAGTVIAMITTRSSGWIWVRA